MKELNQYRTQLINKLTITAKDFQAACLAVKDPFAALDEGSWNVHQVAAHTRDVNKLVYGMRAQKTAQEDNPEFQNFDGDEYTREHYSAEESLPVLLDGFVQNVETLAGILRALPPEAWSRVSRHAKLGDGFTLQTWVERDLAHIEEHLETVRKAQ
ncbi:MAG: DinB family protein [Chloroflexota bacterium]